MQARNLLSLAAVRVPHELLKRLPTGLTEVNRRELDGKVVVAATATAEFAEFLAGGDRASRFSAQQGRRGGGAQMTGSVELIFAADGRLESFTVETRVQHERRGEQKRLLRYALTDYETTQYEVPKAVLDLLVT
ncbi:MAG: hypothetical protein FJ293_16115 [Planctomycetes bacterium]|nr:hypothetical protein [Planctomycetota bacterium]